jgi:hypothetical protein
MKRIFLAPPSIQSWSPELIALVLMVLGAGLRIWQFAAGASLWFDEIALARSFIERSWVELLSAPLSFGQVAPLGFVLVEKFVVVAFGPSDYALRAFPLICSLLSLVVFWRVAKLVLDPPGALVALALFSAAAPLVIYGAQVKQYAGDVLVSLWLLWLVLRSGSAAWTYGQALGIGAAGFVGAAFSQPAVFVIAGIGGTLALVKRDGAPAFRPLTITLVFWAAAATAGILIGIHDITPGGQVFLPAFWSGGFAPLSWQEEFAKLWPWEPLKHLLKGRGALVSLGYPSPRISLLLMFLGCLWIYRIDKGRLLLLTAPIIVTLAAAILRLYPFSDRLILFLLPVFLLLLAAGIRCGAAAIARLSRPLALAAALFITGPGIAPIIKEPPPYRVEEVKPLLAYLQSARRPGDAIYLYYGAWQAVQFYGGRYGLDGQHYLSGDCHRGYPRRYLEELDRFRGHSRVWLVLVHAVPQYRERDDIVAYLDALGARLDYRAEKSRYFQRSPEPAELILYDLSDAERLRRVSAATFALRGRVTVDPKLPCSIHERPARRR